MHAVLSALSATQPLEARLEQIIESATAQLEAGRPVDVDALAAAHPEFAEQLRTLLPMVAALVGMGGALADPAADLAPANGHAAAPPHRQLGDFRILRELGRGGMGAVYEAEQLTMGRRVALKVLPFAALADERSLQRFRNEVRAAAALDHPNIVSVYSVGEERGVHFYAMHLIRGQTLAELIAGLRNDRNGSVRVPLALPVSETPDHTGSLAAPPPSTKVDEQARISTAADSRQASATHFRRAAQLGIQAAEALQHAHDQGVLHRDVKPGNLMLDAAGKLYVTDFGLARIEADAGMTMTGDIVGTLRYMAPEQALAKRVVIDHRADVYSLGATLYELIALKPVFDETDRSELLKQIAFQEPRPLRKVDGRITPELETIVHKAIAKNPDERYQSSQALADDLRALLEHRPIKAKPSTLWRRGAKWSRRHRHVVGASATTLLVSAMVVAGSAGWAIRDQQSRKATLEDKVLLTLNDVQSAYAHDQLLDALASLKEAENLLSVGEARPELRQQVQQWHADLAMAQRLESIRLDTTTMTLDDQWNLSAAPDSYRKAFDEYGLDVDGGDLSAVADRIRDSPIKPHLVAAIDDWATIGEDRERQQVLRVVRAADDDPWRNRLRDAIENDDVENLKALAADQGRLGQSRATVVTVTNCLIQAGLDSYATELLRREQRNHPTDFWINYTLGSQLERQNPREGIGYLIVAHAQRPDNGATHNALGNAYFGFDDFPRAEIEFREAIRLQPDQEWHHKNLAQTLEAQGRFEEAESMYRVALRKFPKSDLLHLRLGKLLLAQNRDGEAEAAFREAVRSNPKNGAPYLHLFNLFLSQKRWTEAKALREELLTVTHNNPNALNFVAWTMAKLNFDHMRDGPRAVDLAAQACERTEFRDADIVDTLAAAYAEAGDFQMAVKWSEKSLELEPENEELKMHLSSFRNGKPVREDW